MRTGRLVRARHGQTTTSRWRWFPRNPRWQRSRPQRGGRSGDRGIEHFDVVIIGGGPGRLRRRPLRRRRRAVGGRRRARQGGRHLPAPGLRAGQGVPGDGRRLPHRALGAPTSGSRAGADQSDPTVEFAVSQERKQQVVDQLFKGLSGLLKGRGVTVFNGSGTLLADHRVRIAGNDGSTIEVDRHRRRAGRRLGAPDHPGLRHRRHGGADLGRGPGPRRRSRPRWRSSAAGPSAASSPRCSPTSGSTVTVFEALPTILNGCDEDVVAHGGPVVQEAGDRRQGGRHSCRATRPDPSGRGTVVSFGDGEKLAVDAVVVSVGRRPRTEGLVAPGTGVVDRRAGLRGGRRHHAHRRRRRVGGGRRGGRHPAAGPRGASPRRSW